MQSVESAIYRAATDRSPIQGSMFLYTVTQGFTLDAERDANVCGALCVVTLGCDSVAPAGLRFVSGVYSFDNSGNYTPRTNPRVPEWGILIHEH